MAIRYKVTTSRELILTPREAAVVEILGASRNGLTFEEIERGFNIRFPSTNENAAAERVISVIQKGLVTVQMKLPSGARYRLTEEGASAHGQITGLQVVQRPSE